MDQTGSGESKQPAEKSGEPSASSAGKHLAGSEHSEQENSPENARRAFDLLERFSGELEEILQSLERARGSAAPAEESPPAPERAYRPSSIRFDSSPISTRIDPYALPPVESPGATARPVPRFLLEAIFLMLVAAISARAGLRPLLIATAEAVAFLIVASIELAIARESRHVQRFPAATPLFPTPEAHETRTTSRVTSVTLDQVEPLVWRSDRQEAAAEADWPLVAYELPSEAEETEEAQEGVTEISAAKQPEVDLFLGAPKSAPEAQPEADLESAAPMPAAEPEPAAEAEPVAAAEVEIEPELESPAEAVVEEREPARARRFRLFRHEEKPLEAELAPETAAEPEGETEVEPKTEMEPEAEPEGASEAVAEESEPEPPRHFFHPFRHEEKTLEAELELEAAAEPEAETEVESKTEMEPEPPRHFFHPFRHEEKALEAELELEAAAEPEGEIESAIEPEGKPEAEAESPEAISEESEPERPRRFHLLRHAAGEPAAEPEARLESTVEIPASEAESERHGLSHLFERAEKPPAAEPEAEPEVAAESEVETDVEPEVAAESLEAITGESKPERHGLFHLIEREEKSSEVEAEPESDLGSIPEIFAAEAEPEQPRRFHLFRHEEKVLDAETGSGAGAEPEAEPESAVENPSEAVAEESEPAQPRRFHLLRHAAGEPEIEQDAEALGGQDESRESASAHGPVEEPERVAETVEMTIEIDLPPEITVGEIEHALEDLGQREPGLRRRRWSLGAGADKDVAARAVKDEASDGESELRHAAEQERRRREREYLRNLRVPR